jgi:hypothetical protein
MSGYAAAWKLSVYSAMKYYATLPREHPDCYVAAAAAKGHRCIVRSEAFLLTDGTTVHVNPQMRYLKCGELLLKAAAPRLHRLCRAVYDAVGPVLARGLIWSVLADLAYLILKPAEWLCRAVFKGLFPAEAGLAKRLYRRDLNS